MVAKRRLYAQLDTLEAQLDDEHRGGAAVLAQQFLSELEGGPTDGT